MQSIDEVVVERGRYDGELGELVNRLVDEGLREVGTPYKVLRLSPPESPLKLHLKEPIPNDKRSKSGKPTAFTMGQRYVSSAKLIVAKTTSDLD